MRSACSTLACVTLHSWNQTCTQRRRYSLYFVCIGIGRFVLAYTYNSLPTYNAYRIVRTIRYAYLKAALSQEIAFFDLGTGGSISTQATTNGRLIQGGITEKLGLTFRGLSSFVTAFIVAFATNWKLTLITLCIAPATMAVMASDPHAEDVVQQALDRASKGRTTIVVSHKLATIRKADNIVVMKAGHIVEQGTHESLLAEDGAYAQLVKIQNLTLKPSESDSESDDTDEVIAGDPADFAKPLSKIATRDRARMEIRKDRDDYDEHKQLGLTTVIFRLVKSPLSYYGHIYLFSSVVLVLALLLANVTDVFPLTGSAMVENRNFFAAMFIVLAVGFGGKASTTCYGKISHSLAAESNTGALASRVDSNQQAILELMGFNVDLILIAVLNVLACSVLGIAYSWKLGLVVVLAGLPPFIGSGWFKIRFDAKLDRAISKRNSNSAAVAPGAVTAIRTVSLLAIEESVLDKLG
ncbi:hypothetical protein J3459_009871 [Metarhizium acridum]|nr:hypothetical protein J3459_009871 [Metarhizium acridum]